MLRVFKIVCAWLLLFTGGYFAFSGGLQYLASRTEQQEAAREWPPSSPKEDAGEAPRLQFPKPPSPKDIKRGESVAKLHVPRLNEVLYVVEGTDLRTLRKGPGHMEGTSLPGGPGNCVIAGHRDTHFRFLKDLRDGDEILLETQSGTYRYKVAETSVISPANTQCLRDTREPVLNLITCYPFYYVGSAPKRFVVHATLEPAATRAQAGA
ncbi:MAG: hypothetical protein NVS1B6_12360 [Steroidobacteraceae bacterium]